MVHLVLDSKNKSTLVFVFHEDAAPFREVQRVKLSREEYVCGMVAEDRRYEVEFQADVSFIAVLYTDRFHT